MKHNGCGKGEGMFRVGDCGDVLLKALLLGPLFPPVLLVDYVSRAVGRRRCGCDCNCNCSSGDSCREDAGAMTASRANERDVRDSLSDEPADKSPMAIEAHNQARRSPKRSPPRRQKPRK